MCMCICVPLCLCNSRESMCVCHMCALGVFPSIIIDVVVDKYTSTERACLKMLKIAGSLYNLNLYFLKDCHM